MPSGDVLLIAALAAMGFYGAAKIGHLAKKTLHESVCLAKTAHRCPPKAPAK